MMSVRLKIIKEVKRMADIISGNSRFGDGNNSKIKSDSSCSGRTKAGRKSG